MALNFCPSCGAKLGAPSKFCPACGVPLAADPARPAVMVVSPPSRPAAPPPPPSRNVGAKPANAVRTAEPAETPAASTSSLGDLADMVGGVASLVGSLASAFGGKGSQVAQMANSVAGLARSFNQLTLPSGKQVVIGGYRKDPPDENDVHYARHNEVDPDSLPDQVDLRQWMTAVESQGQIGSCTANAIAGAYEYLANRTIGHRGDVSRLFIYYLERKMQDQVDEDAGGYLRDGIKVLKKHGVCSEPTWPYDEERFTEEPSPDAFEEAKQHTIDEYHRVPIDLHAMKTCLAEGYPFVFGMTIFKAFESHDHHGRIRTPRATDKSEGGHAMLCVGYSDADQVFIVRNSWGTDWGDEGYCYVPYDYLCNEEYTHDCWTVRKAHNLDFAANDDAAPHRVERGEGGSIFDLDESEEANSVEEEAPKKQRKGAAPASIFEAVDETAEEEEEEESDESEDEDESDEESEDTDKEDSEDEEEEDDAK